MNSSKIALLLSKSSKAVPVSSNLNSVATALEEFGARVGLDKPHRFVHYGSQLGHESGDFRYDREIWGPTAAQSRYEGRRDLGNVIAGDGSKFRGRGPIQITGRYNYTKFTEWARRADPSAPDFTKNPDKVLTDPWEGLVPIWFWRANNLNDLADTGDVRAVTRRINGGFNGLKDRYERYDRLALVVLGFGPANIAGFQREAKLTVDGVSGPMTRAALHTALKGRNYL